MSKFYKKAPVVEVFRENERGDIIRLKRQMVYRWHGVILTVPAGFECDGASVPRFLWDSVSPQIDPRTLAGAIGHDFLYRRHPAGWTRAEADDFFYDVIREDGLSWWKAQKAYWGIRLFGGKAWEARGK